VQRDEVHLGEAGSRRGPAEGLSVVEAEAVPGDAPEAAKLLRCAGELA
jgi:hypothetical protein